MTTLSGPDHMQVGLGLVLCGSDMQSFRDPSSPFKQMHLDHDDEPAGYFPYGAFLAQFRNYWKPSHAALCAYIGRDLRPQPSDEMGSGSVARGH